MNSFKIIFLKDYLKSNNFWLSFAFVFIFLALLLSPSFLFFYLDIINLDDLFNSFGTQKNTYTLLYHKVGELIPWVIVCITALIVINGNTIFYILTFKEELIEENYKTKKFWFSFITWLFVIWGAVSAVYLVKFSFRFSDLTAILNEAKSNIEIDKFLVTKTSDLFTLFINQVEYYTIATILIFILIDIFSRVVKSKQLAVIETKLKVEPTNPELNKSFKKLILQKEFVANQCIAFTNPL